LVVQEQLVFKVTEDRLVQPDHRDYQGHPDKEEKLDHKDSQALLAQVAQAGSVATKGFQDLRDQRDR
jgi:hypothetical protein